MGTKLPGADQRGRSYSEVLSHVMAEFDPYHKWLGIPPRDQPPHHYRLLGIELYEGDPEVIEAAAERHVSYLQTVATGPQLAESQRLLNEISAARRCLLTASLKSAYDAKLRESLSAISNRESVKPPPPSRKGATAADTPQIELTDTAPRTTAKLPGKALTAPLKRRKRVSIWPLVIVLLLVISTGVVVALVALGKLDPWLKPTPMVATTQVTPMQPPAASTPAASSASPMPEVKPLNNPQLPATTKASTTTASASPPSASPPPIPATPVATNPSTVPSTTPSDEPTAHYPFDGDQTLVTEVGGKLSGTNHGAQVIVDPQRGTVLQLSNKANVELPVQLSADTTVAFWLRTAKSGPITSRWEFGVPVFNVPHDLRIVVVGNSACAANYGDEVVFDSERLITNNAWHHIAIVRRSQLQQLKMYIDGQEARSKNGWQSTKQPAGTLTLGCTEKGDLFYDGLLDALRIYPRALGEGDIQKLSKPGTDANNVPPATTPKTTGS